MSHSFEKDNVKKYDKIILVTCSEKFKKRVLKEKAGMKID